MTASSEHLWLRLLGALKHTGALPDGRMTPAEIGKHVLSSIGDDRVDRFVWQYYYPKVYGHAQSPLSDHDAEQLVRDLEREGLPHLARQSTSDQGPSLLCAVCGRPGNK